MRASRSLTGACVVAAALMLPAASASARDVTEFSAQDDRYDAVARRACGEAARRTCEVLRPARAPRGPVGAPRVMGGPPRELAV